MTRSASFAANADRIAKADAQTVASAATIEPGLRRAKQVWQHKGRWYYFLTGRGGGRVVTAKAAEVQLALAAELVEEIERPDWLGR